MSNYSQNVFFGPKDTLTSGDPAKVIKGTEFDAELALISTAITSKEDSVDKGVANGYASLDASAFVPTAQLPVVPVIKGGTGVATLAAGNLLLGAGTGAMTALAPSTANNVCISSGTAWTSRALAAGDIPALDISKITTGTWGITRGGTGKTSWTSATLLTGNGTGVPNEIAPGVSGNVLQSNGTTWASTTLASAGIAISTRTISAGVGLSGGGDLSANRTISMGTPGSLTTSTANSASGTTHTHAIGGGIVKSHVAATGGQITVSTGDPTGGTNGDIWFKVSA